jgi:hypothetical protein
LSSVRADARRRSHSFCKAQISLWKTEPEPLCQSVRWIVQVPKLHSTCVACKDAQPQGTSDSVTCCGMTCPLACQLPRSSPVGAVRWDTLCSYMHCTSAICPADAASAATVRPDPPNVLQAMMQLRQAKSRAEAANKLALETEKERDTAEKAVEELKRQLQPKRARTDDDAIDAHEKLSEVDNWDLIDHRQQATRVQNRRNVQSHGARLYAHQADLLDRRRIYCHIITRDSES